MDPNQMRALDQCHPDILRDVDIDKQFLLRMYIDNIITQAQSEEIEQETTRRAKASKLLEVLPRRGPSCFRQFVNKLRQDYPWIAEKLDTEHEKAKREIPKDINTKLLDVYNNQLCRLVHGLYDQSSVLPLETHPEYLVNQISDSVRILHSRCYRSLGISLRDQDPIMTCLSLSQLIDRKVHCLQNSLTEMKWSLHEEKKKKNKSNIIVLDQKYEKEITKTKKALEKQKEANKKLESSLKVKTKQILSLSRESTTLQTQNQQLKERVQELESALVYQRQSSQVSMITEWKM
ncbi:Hypothetical predicted protein [Mytilus galloprovincialis]|uniref:CARD domain-containing protein n=1 Tax=Mytilus galloprovincialis TaxID=29158 RepID=A0A8B6EI29_MYTGA|nr:Hypothetical predicted protein [Mytilus galloprovincialis]